MDSRMEASVQTYEYGLITASLYVKDNMVAGMLTTTYNQSSEESECSGVGQGWCDRVELSTTDQGEWRYGTAASV